MKIYESKHNPTLKLVWFNGISERPNLSAYLAMRQDYSPDPIYLKYEQISKKSEDKLGELVWEKAVKFQHYGVCYDAQTEVLTEQGWKKWEDVTGDEKLASIDIKSQEVNYELPSRLIRYYTEEKLYQVKGRDVDFCVTLDHNLVVSHRQCRNRGFTDWYKAKAKEKIGKPYRVLKSGHLGESNTVSVNNPYLEYLSDSNFLKLIGFWLGDGTIRNSGNQLSFNIRKKRKIQYLYSIVDSQYIKKCCNAFVVSLPQIGNYFSLTFSKEKEKYIPESFLRLPYNQVISFLEGLKESDGTNKRGNTLFSYDSTSLSVINMLQGIVVTNGLTANITLNGEQRNPKHKQCYRLTITDKITSRVEVCQKSRTPATSECLIDYSGYVYCATVSTGALITRRNGIPVISGNCEHTGLVFNIVGFPHDVPMQHRTHRVACSFDVMSQRYTGKHFKAEYDKQIITVNGNQIFSDDFIKQYFYLDVVGEAYVDRNGTKYQHTSAFQQRQIEIIRRGLIDYCELLNDGIPEEKARRFLPQGIRQHYIFSCNPRSLEHLLDVRTPKDVQFEFRLLSELFMEFYQDYNPFMAQKYREKRYQKNKLAP